MRDSTVELQEARLGLEYELGAKKMKTGSSPGPKKCSEITSGRSVDDSPTTLALLDEILSPESDPFSEIETSPPEVMPRIIYSPTMLDSVLKRDAPIPEGVQRKYDPPDQDDSAPDLEASPSREFPGFQFTATIEPESVQAKFTGSDEASSAQQPGLAAMATYPLEQGSSFHLQQQEMPPQKESPCLMLESPSGFYNLEAAYAPLPVLTLWDLRELRTSDSPVSSELSNSPVALPAFERATPSPTL
ncbi:hypothetical protein V5799_004158 [Amblyomma americanum]|uniref:Uncharacterized protein n=1 Tax=Amblyomma americanum TaxID=6943 RepID=A0AAQ4D6V8_AMBAM